MSRIRIEEHRGDAALQALRPQWSALHRELGASPFLSWEWQEAWLRHLAPERAPTILTAHRGETLVGLWALGEERVRLGWGEGILRLSMLGERVGGADYLDLLAERSGAQRIAEAMLEHLDGRFDLLDLDDMPADALLLPAVARRYLDAPGATRRLLLRHVCPYVELEGSWEQILRRSSRGSNFKRRLRQLQKEPGFELRTVTDPAEVDAAFDRFVALHQQRWQERGGSDALSREEAVRFHREVARRFAEAGWLRFEELWVDGGCRATLYGMDAGDTYVFFQSGFDPAWADRSVGLVLLGLSIEGALSRGMRVYDFLHGTEPYKFDWATGSRQTVGLRITTSGLWSALWRASEEAEAIARAAAHSVLPDRMVGVLRRARKAVGG